MNRNYLYAAARHAGVPPMFIDDAVQDIAIRLWLASEEASPRAVVKHAAVDAVRHYRGDSRHAPRPEMVPIDDETRKLPDPVDRFAYVDDFDQVSRNAAQLTRRQRESMELELAGHRPERERQESHYVHVSQARRRLRAA